MDKYLAARPCCKLAQVCKVCSNLEVIAQPVLKDTYDGFMFDKQDFRRGEICEFFCEIKRGKRSILYEGP